MEKNNTPNQGTLSSATPSNVIDIRSGQTLLPRQMRAAIMGQYMESKTLDHTPEQFSNSLEKRLLTDLAYAGAAVIKDVIKETFGESNE